MVVFLFFRFLSIFHKISGFAEFRTFIIRLWTGEIAWKMSELWSFFFFFQFLSTFHQVFRVLPLEKLNSLLNSKYFRLWMGEIAWKTSELCYFFCLLTIHWGLKLVKSKAKNCVSEHAWKVAVLQLFCRLLFSAHVEDLLFEGFVHLLDLFA